MGEPIDEFLNARTIAVFGASNDQQHPAYRLVKNLSQMGRRVFPINPRIDKVDGMRCYGTLDELPGMPQAVVTTLSPILTAEVLKSALGHGIRLFWLQPGSESQEVLRIADENGVCLIHSQCLLEQLGVES